MASTSTIQSPIPDPIECNNSIYMFPNSPDVPKAEILFFHDVLWKGYEKPHVQSWTLSETPNVCWPEVLLKPKYPGARIWYVCYDGAIRKTDAAGHMNLFQIAENLRHDILDIYAENRPVVLVGHGFAGLIIKKLIEGMVLRDPDRCKVFLENVKGIFYFAPPFMGTKLVDSMKDLPHAGSLVQFLVVLNPEIGRLNDWFRQWRQRKRCQAAAIGTALPTELAPERKMALLCKGKLTHVVEEGSARYDVDDYYTSNTDHFGISKLRGETDSSFRRLTKLIEEVIPARACGSAELIADRIESACNECACNELVNNILIQLPQLETIWITIDQLQKISKFPEMESHLTGGLAKAGFEATSKCAGGVFWQKY